MYSLITSPIWEVLGSDCREEHQGSPWATSKAQKVVRGWISLKDIERISVHFPSQVWQLWLPEAKMNYQEGKEEQLRSNAGFPPLSVPCGKEQNVRKRHKESIWSDQFGLFGIDFSLFFVF